MRELLQQVLVDQSARQDQQLQTIALAAAREFTPWASVE